MNANSIDAGITAFMRRYGQRALRYSLALIFIWFGILKPFGISPAEPLVVLTVDWEGQYIVKNLLIISAALVVGGTVRGGDRRQAS